MTERFPVVEPPGSTQPPAKPAPPAEAAPAPAAEIRGAPSGIMHWLPVALAAIVMVALVRNSSGPITDPDTLWHILAGERLSQTWVLSGPDPFSKFSTLPWVYNQWLPELAMATAAKIAGLAGVAWLAHLGRLMVFVCILVSCRRQAGPLVAVLAAVTGLVGAAGGLGPRPQLAGFCLLAVTVTAWLATEQDGRIRWWLVPLTWVWASSHGTWVIGIGLSAVATLGLLADRKVTDRRILLLPLAQVVVATITFVGPQLWQSVLAINAANTYIQEWQAPSIREPSVVVTFVMVAILALLWARRGASLSWTRVGLFGVALVCSVLYLRTVALAAIIVAPLLAAELQRLTHHRWYRPGRAERLTYAVGMALSLAFAAVVMPITSSQPAKVPTALNPVLASLPAGTVVWNTDALGGWLMYEHPNISHTMDTRSEVYGSAYARHYVEALGASPGWLSTIAATGARYVLVDTDSALRSILQTEHHWTVLGTDEGYTLLVEPPGDTLG